MNDIVSLYKKFGFNEPPFNQGPDTSFLFLGKQHTAALDHLQYGLLIDGFSLLTGEVGMGKTLLCRQLLKSTNKGVKTVYIYNTDISLIDLLKSIYYDLSGSQLERDSYSNCFFEINQLLIRVAEGGEKVVILLDEAQSLEPSVLEGLRQLSNLETEKKKLLSFILVGQPELKTRLADRNMRQLEQRISVRYVLKPFGLSETKEYINHRLSLAATNTKYTMSPCFSKYATYLVHRYSRGIPRRINQICDRALLASFNAGKTKIGARIVRRAAREILG